ncbi:MAG: hypothetical protein RLO52_12655, partial [Sandaracinaceae bacterium]
MSRLLLALLLARLLVACGGARPTPTARFSVTTEYTSVALPSTPSVLGAPREQRPERTLVTRSGT